VLGDGPKTSLGAIQYLFHEPSLLVSGLRLVLRAQAPSEPGDSAPADDLAQEDVAPRHPRRGPEPFARLLACDNNSNNHDAGGEARLMVRPPYGRMPMSTCSAGLVLYWCGPTCG